MAVSYKCRERASAERSHKFPNAIATIRVPDHTGSVILIGDGLLNMQAGHPDVRWVIISNQVFVEYPAGYVQFRTDAIGHILLAIGEQ